MRIEAGWSLSDVRIGCPMRHLTSPKHIYLRASSKTSMNLINVTAKVFSGACIVTRRARTSPSTFLFLPIQLSNSRMVPETPKRRNVLSPAFQSGGFWPEKLERNVRVCRSRAASPANVAYKSRPNELSTRISNNRRAVRGKTAN